MAEHTQYIVQRSTRFSRYAGVILALVVLLLIAMPWWAGRGMMHTVTEFMCFLALAQMWNLLAGYGGLVSVGQQAFVGIGAYALVVMALHLGVNPFVAIPLAGIVAMLMAIPTAAVAFKLKGAYFAIGTWVIAEVFRLVVDNIPFLGGGVGVSITRALIGFPFQVRESLTLWIAIAIGVGSVLAVYLLLRSNYGLAFTALRDDEAAAESVGVRIARVKWAVYLASALGCGMTGALIYLTKLRVTPDGAFSIEWTIYMIFIVVIGGIGTIEGPIVGTIVFFVLREQLADFGSWYLIALGVLAILIMRVSRKGLWGLVSQKIGLSLFPVQRHVKPGK